MKKSYVLAGVSILLWSSLATVSKLLLGTISAYQVLGISAAFATVALFIYNMATGKLSAMKSLRAKDYLILVLIGLPGTLFYNLFYYAGAAILPASQAFIVNYLWPIMSVLFACILLKEKLTGRKVLAFVISFLGVATVAGGGLLHFEVHTLWGVLLCMGAAISYGAYTALNQRWHVCDLWDHSLHYGSPPADRGGTACGIGLERRFCDGGGNHNLGHRVGCRQHGQNIQSCLRYSFFISGVDLFRASRNAQPLGGWRTVPDRAGDLRSAEGEAATSLMRFENENPTYGHYHRPGFLL